MSNYLEEINKLTDLDISFVVVTLVNIKGSSPQEVGAKMIVSEKDLLHGTVGGGKIEAYCIKHAQSMIQSKMGFNFQEWNLQTDIGMTCGGVVSFSFEPYFKSSNFKIAIFGAGHIAQELIQVLLRLKCQIKCVDPRSEWLLKLPKSKKLEIIETDYMSDVIKSLDPDTFILSLTMGHAYDRPILAVALKSNYPFIGVIGSDQKAKVLKNELKTIDHLSDSQIEKLHCPVGLPIGSNDPSEIAISIVAQLLEIRDRK